MSVIASRIVSAGSAACLSASSVAAQGDAGSIAGQLAPEDGGSPVAEPVTIDGNFQVTLRQPDADEG